MRIPIPVPIDEILATPPAPADGGDEIGRSREWRAIRGFRLGHGPVRVSLLAGCHADEPVGPWMLRRLAAFLSGGAPSATRLLESATWTILPHVNPDGEARNLAWTGDGVDLDLARGIDAASYLRHVVREAPGDDIEFGFPHASGVAESKPAPRPENLAAAAYLGARVERSGPFHLHASLHGMAHAAGPWFLLDRAWIDRTAPLRKHLTREVAALGYALHDVERHGEKGFHRIERGFCTRPESQAMRRYFEERGDPATAAKFRPNSMEFVRSLGGDPLTVVSEMPLFVVEGASEVIDPADPVMERLRAEALPLLRAAAIQEDATFGSLLETCGIRPMPIGDQMRLQLRLVEAGIGIVVAGGSG